MNILGRLLRNKRSRHLVTGAAALVCCINFYLSVYSVAGFQAQRFGQILKLTSKDESHYLEVSSKHLNRLPADASLREQLQFQYPYDSSIKIPRIIWQTWKYPRDDPRFERQLLQHSQSWIDLHHDYAYNLIPDEASDDLIKSLYESIPQVYDAFVSLPKAILKADFFRYLILFARGGIYSDVDTVPLKPANVWVSNNETIYNDVNDAGLVIGIEADPDRDDWNVYYAKRVQFCQWTIQSKPGHPMLGELIANITETTLRKKHDGTLSIISGKDAGADIMNWTGPGIFTDEIFTYFNDLIKLRPNVHITNHTPVNKYNTGLDITKDGVDWRFFTLMEQAVVFDDVLVLPITGFSPGVGHMGSKHLSHEDAYVHHMFEGSWKPENERMKGTVSRHRKD